MVHFMYDATDERRRMSREAATTALTLVPGLPEGHYAMGVYHYWGNKQYDSAAAELVVAAAALASDAEILAMAGFVQRRRGDWQAAVAYMERAAQLDPGALQADLGNTYEALGRVEEALSALSTAQRTRPEGHFEVARGLVFLRRDGTTDTLRTALQGIPPGFDPNAEMTLARIELAGVERRPDDVLQALAGAPEPVADQNVYWPRALIAGRAHRLAGRESEARAGFDSARVVLEAAVASNPDDARMHVALASSLAGLGRSDGAVREAELALQIMPPTRDAMIGQSIERQAAAVYSDLGQIDRAVALLTSFFGGPTIGYTRFYLTIDPTWDRLRNHAGFRRLVAG
jgi:serine/threonine-protein kinase